jgi:hypothetical protein
MHNRILSRALPMAFLIFLLPPAAAQKRKMDETAHSFVITRGTEIVTKKPKPRSKSPGPIGVGYTVFKKAENGKPVRVNPMQEFQNGDKLRFVIESNTDGYLYIFHQEQENPPKMLFPDARLKWGDNRIEAHTPYETPSSREPGDWWFNFIGPAATERFYLVVSRTPLSLVWSNERLLAHCQQSPENCPWRPASAAWKQLLAQATTKTRESRSQTFDQVQTETEQKAIQRDVKLLPGDPAPAVIKVNTSPTAKMIMAMVEVVHKE